MDYNKSKLKDLLKIIRDNKKTQEVQTLLGIANLKYAKKKDIVDFLNGQNDVVNISNEEENKIDDDYETDQEDRSELKKQELEQIPEIEPVRKVTSFPKVELPEKDDIILNLDNIKNKKKNKRSVEFEDPELKKYRDECILMIEKLRARYPFLRFENINYDDPIEALKIVQNKVAAKNFSNLVTEGFYMGCDVVETAATETPMIKKYCKLQGFANNVRASDAIKDVLDELIIKYSPQMMGEGGVLSPEVRLCLALIGCAWATHSNNGINGVKNKSTAEFKYDKTL